MPEARTRIHIGAQETLIETWSPEIGTCEWMLDIGTEALGDGPFRHDPPTALEIENAIEHVENAVMPLLRQMPPGTQLVTSDPVACELHRLTNERDAGEPLLLIDDVELVFNQIAAVAMGRPVRSAGLPVGVEFPAYVLILRETMHHLGFASISVLPAPLPSSSH